MTELERKIHLYGIVPVVKFNHVEDAIPLAKALCKGGLAIAEVTYRTDCAHDAMVEMRKVCPDMVIGAGTVLTKEQVDSAIDAGAQFIVSPGLNPKIVKYCKEKQIPILPGTSCPSDMEIALENDLEVVKFFPAEANGGLQAIQAMSAPYSQLKFMPTGGINEKNLIEYLKYPKILACGGTWMVKESLIENKEFDKIEELTRNAVEKMLNIQIQKIQLSSKEDVQVLSQFSEDSVFENEENCITYSTNFLDRAIFYLKQKGIEFDDQSVQYDDKNQMISICSTCKISGFTLQLVQGL